MPEDGQDDR